MIQIPGRPDLLGYLHQVGKGLRNGFGGTDSNHSSESQCRQRAQQGDSDSPVARGIITLTPLFQYALAFLVCQVKIFGRTLHPRACIFLQIEDLQFSYRGVSLVHLFPLLHERFGEVPGPVLFRLLHLHQCRPLLLGGGYGHRALHPVNQIVKALVYVVGFATISAKQVVGQVEAVLHHLKSEFVGGICQLQRLRGGGLGAVFAVHCRQVYGEQHHDHGEHRSEAHIKFSADRHAISSALLLPRFLTRGELASF